MAGRRTRVVVVNDNPDFLEVMEELLRNERYSATTIDGDREDAVAQIRLAKPDVLMIDLRLGTEGLHGWDVVKDVRADATLSQLPTLICSADLSALDDVQDEMEAMPHVATLPKPFSIAELTEKLDQLAGS